MSERVHLLANVSPRKVFLRCGGGGGKGVVAASQATLRLISVKRSGIIDRSNAC